MAKRKPAKMILEILSHPSDLRGDPTGGKLPWMIVEDDEEAAAEKRLGLMRSAARRKEEGRRGKQPGRTGVDCAWYLIEQLIILGTIELGRIYDTREVEELIDCEISGGFDMISLRMAEQTDFRAQVSYHDGAIKGYPGRGKTIIFANRPTRKVP